MKSAMFLAALLLVCACGGGHAHPPAPPPSDAEVWVGPPVGTRPRSDSGASDAAGDSSAAGDAGSPVSCTSVPSIGNQLSLSFTTSAGGPELVPTHAIARWLPASCDTADPQVVISLGDSCDPLSGSRLAFRVQRGALQRGELTIGFPLFVDNPHSFSVRLVLPPSAGPEPSIWGDCTRSTGSITFDDNGWAAGSVESASFDITLTDCSSTPALEDVRASGSFYVTLSDAFEDVCTPAR